MAVTGGNGVLSPPLRGLTVGLVLIISMAAFEALAVATAMPAVEDDLGGVRLYGWTFSAYLLASLVGIAYAGVQADRHGPARPLVTGLVLFALGLLVAGLAPSMLVVVAGRAIQGLGAGAVPAVAYVAVARGYPEALQPRILALYATAWVVPGFVGPSIAGGLTELVGWRVVFLGLVPLVGLAGVLTAPPLARLGRPNEQGRPGGSVAAAGGLALGVGLMLAGLGSGSLLALPPLMLAGLLISWRAAPRLVPGGTFRAAPGLPATVAGMALLNLTFFGADAFVPFMLTNLRDQTTLVAGAVLTSATLTWTGGTWMLERNANRWSQTRMIAFGFGLVALGCLGLLAVVSPAVPVAFAVVAWGVAGFGIGIAYQGLTLAALRSAGSISEGAVATAVKTGEFSAAAIGAGLTGAIVGAGESGGWLGSSLAASFVLMSLVAVVAIAAVRRIDGPVALPALGAASGD